MERSRSISRWHALAFTSLGHLVNDGWVTLIPLIADIIENQKQAPPVVVTLISVSFYSSSALLNFFVGHLASRSGSQGRMMASGIAIISLSFLGFDLALGFPNGGLLYFAVACVAVVAGFGSAFYHPIAASIVQTSFGLSTRGRAMGVNGSMGVLGSAIFPPLFLAIALLISQRDTLALMSVCALGGATAIWFGLNGYKKPESGSSGQSAGIRAVLTRKLVTLTAITAVRSAANTGVSVWLPTYITFVRGEGVGSILGLTIAATYLGAIPGQMLFGVLVERLDKRYVLGLSSAGAGLAVLGYIATQGYVAIALITMFGFFSYSTFPTLLSLTSDYVPQSSWTTANGLVWGLGLMGGNVIGPAITLLVIGNGYARMNLAFAILAILGLAGAVVTPLMKKGKYSGGSGEEKEDG